MQRRLLSMSSALIADRRVPQPSERGHNFGGYLDAGVVAHLKHHGGEPHDTHLTPLAGG
jgi:hypothetical protein